MRKNLLWFGIAVLVLGLLAFTFYNIYEIYETEDSFPPSREARVNEYLALERWLTAEGHPVRTVSSGSLFTLKNAEEKTFAIQSDFFDWNNEAIEYLDSWIGNGGSLVLCLTFNRTWNEEEPLGAFLKRLGIKAGEGQGGYDPGFPTFGRNVHFKEPVYQNMLILKDSEGLVRLIQFPYGRGKVAVMGRPRFMVTINLRSEPNARLSWYLLAGENNNDESGVLFIRGQVPPQGLIGRVFQRGDFTIIIISTIALIVAGFWSAIPVFGIVREDKETPGKNLAERFLAEGRFLKSYRSLEHYRAAYKKEIRRRLMKQNLTDDEIIKQAAALVDPEQKALAEKALGQETQDNKHFLESVVILKKILERL